MSFALGSPITWNSAIRLGLGFGAEYALLALIEDAPTALKVATVICAVGALVVLESKDWLNAKRKNSAGAAIAIFGIIYLAFIAYAIERKIYESHTRETLETCYVQASELMRQEIPPYAFEKKHMDPDVLKKFVAAVEHWQLQCAQIANDRMGAIGRERFLDQSGVDLSYSRKGFDVDPLFSYGMNILTKEKTNLKSLIETRAYKD